MVCEPVSRTSSAIGGALGIAVGTVKATNSQALDRLRTPAQDAVLTGGPRPVGGRPFSAIT